MGKDTPAVELAGLGVRFGKRTVLSDFNLCLRRGAKVTLTGPSGCGKSTVLRCVLGLVVPQEGAVRVMGRTLDRNSVWEARRHMSYVAQEPDLGTGTARDVIERPFTYRANADLRGRLEGLPGLMARLNLSEDLLDEEVSDLSGGEKQRFALVSAFLLDRPMLLLDEASSALDRANKQAVSDFLGEARQVAVLSVSHDTEWTAFSEEVVAVPHLAPSGSGRNEPAGSQAAKEDRP